jgi:hypothetical protein
MKMKSARTMRGEQRTWKGQARTVVEHAVEQVGNDRRC